MSKNEQSHKEKPVSELLQEQSKELRPTSTPSTAKWRSCWQKAKAGFPSNCGNIPAVRRFGRRSVRRSDGQHLSESESAKVDGNDLKQ